MFHLLRGEAGWGVPGTMLRSYAKISPMSTDVPEPPPYGALIESARKDAGLSMREAARRAGISDAWWRYLVRGYQKTPGDLAAPADTIARMARTVDLTPERLEAQGQRPDAAAILRDAPERSRPHLTEVPPEGLTYELIEKMAQRIIATSGKNRRVMEAMWAATHVPARERLEQMLDFPRYDPRDPVDFDSDDGADDARDA